MTNGNDLVFGDTKGMAGVVALSPLTKREYFAAMAMQGLANHHSDLYEYAPDGSMTLIASAVQRNAQRAVQQADALIDALNK